MAMCGSIKLKLSLKEVIWGARGSINVAEGRDKWWALVNMVMNIQAPSNAGNFLTCLGMLAS
jgi:hypothetical protein